MLLDQLLRHYLEEVEAAVRNLQSAYVEQYQEEILAANRANLRVRIRFHEDFLLEVNEALVAEARTIEHLGYRYHYQDAQNRLVFRYDNTPHFPDLESFPHHKHTQRGVTACEKPTIHHQIFEEAARFAEG